MFDKIQKFISSKEAETLIKGYLLIKLFLDGVFAAFFVVSISIAGLAYVFSLINK